MHIKSALLLLAVAIAALGQTIKVDLVPNPSGAGSLQAHWGATADGSALLSWLEKSKDGSLALRYATRKGAQWSEPRTICRKPPILPSAGGIALGNLVSQRIIAGGMG
jgi:hypothetical protein